MNRASYALLSLGSWLFSMFCAMLILGIVLAFALFQHYSKDLPDWRQLAEYNPPTVTRLYAADGRVLAEYATEKRVFVPLKAIPRRVIQAFLSAEDKNFYEHTGIDITGIARAIRNNIVHYGQGRSLVGGSTITQQVVKNFLLTSEKSIERKIREAILAVRISQVYSKDKILELYLNQIYLGLGSYGVAAAAQNYFAKSMDELSIEEAALLAAEPKAPANYDPRKNYEAARTRRDWVIDRMREDNYITAEEAAAAKQAPIVLGNRGVTQVTHAEFFAEEVRRLLTQTYGAEVLYEGGLVVKTTLDPELQSYADKALRKALVDYDRRHGWRGALANVGKGALPKEALAKITKERNVPLFDGQRLALVTAVDALKASIAFEDDSRSNIPLALMKWTGAKKPADAVKPGDVVLVSPGGKAWELGQIPEANGAFVALDPHTGRVLAMSGGYAYSGSEFNRATQAKRQPGSAFKPFVYLAALENGFTPTTVIEDAPIELSQGPNLPPWQPQNYEGEFLGAATMRAGLEKSRNTMTVRMTEIIGIDKVVEIGQRFGIYTSLPPLWSIVLGSAETTLLKLANAYGIIADGGRRVQPAIIERIDDRHGQTIYRRDNRVCTGCMLEGVGDADMNDLPPIPADTREQIIDPRVAYQMVSMLEGVTIRGTGARAREIGKIVAGKTGTTNESQDAWFVGFSPDLVAGVYIGYDQPRSLGEKETGGSAALPAFIDFMKNALKDIPNKPFNVPRGIQLVQVDLKTGLPVTEANPAAGAVIEEAFITGAPLYIPGITSADLSHQAEAPLEIQPQEGSDSPIVPPHIAPSAPSAGGLY